MSTEPLDTTQDANTGIDAGEAPAGDAVKAAADRVLAQKAAEDAAATTKRGRGRPRGSKTRNRDRSRERDRRREAPAPEGPAAPEPPAPPAEPTPEELEGLATLVGTVWEIAGGRLRRRPLTGPEAQQLARVAHPVLAKYAGNAFNEWGAEIALGMVLVGLWNRTALPPEPKTDQLDAIDTTGEQAVA